jgi:hypothetical protein
MIADYSRITILNYPIEPLHIGNISFITNFMWIHFIYTTWLLNIKYEGGWVGKLFFRLPPCQIHAERF